ncbi:anti-sigma factor [Parabacteroides goldsteinii]|uniref:FecR domain-containing protein n=1 Tax=Parabacteroides goldsteinii TaxID=328812 RepID=UPI001FBADDD6|nr:FecR domain-containing protein [Parabacteroides goldsteinii]GKG76559.1 anti-sigma factor [Parabacteroides goldsteinii]GKG80033.1 anti-sigma factor [Parabacteroides goldsteinii]
MHDLLSKYLTGDISSEEKLTLFQQLRENPELKKEAAGIQNLSALVSMAREEYPASDMQYRSFVHLRKKRAFFFNMRRIAGYAAIMVFSVLSTYLLMTYMGEGRQELARYQEFSTPPGQRARVLLADGTEVWLNANSTLRYPERFNLKQREVELQGEAFFEVEKNKEKPFVVKTSKMDIQVTGTKFNVSAYEAEAYFVTSLVEGAVSVSCANDWNRTFSLRPQQQIIVSDSSSEVALFENTDFLSWREGVFVFDDMLLTDIIKKLELFYDVSIVVKNTELGSFRYTGKFRQRDGVESVLRKLQIVYPFTYTKDDERNLIVLQ